MPQVTITYNNPKTLSVLKSMAKYFDFIISSPKKETTREPETFTINGIQIDRGDSSLDISELTEAFTGKNIDAKEIRKQWQRRK